MEEMESLFHANKCPHMAPATRSQSLQMHMTPKENITENPYPPCLTVEKWKLL
jgi:hypothetical protein